MKATEILKKTKELLSIETEVDEVKLAQATLENGTIIEAEAIAEGNEVFIVTEDERVPLPVGEYTLEDGQMLLVQEEGVIASIGAAPQEEEQAAEEQLEEEDKQEMNYATKEELAEVKEMIEEIKQMIDHKDKMSEELSEIETETETVEPVQEQKEELSAETPVAKVKHNPEQKTEKTLNLYSQKRVETTLDRVLRKISKINK
jgi:hypothetical protein